MAACAKCGSFKPTCACRHGSLVIIATRGQMPVLKKAGWTIVSTYGGGSYIMEVPLFLDAEASS